MITPENKERIRRKVRGIIAYRRENGMTKEMIWAVLGERFEKENWNGEEYEEACVYAGYWMEEECKW